MKIKLNELEWKKFKIVYQEWDNDVIDYEATYKQLEPLSIIKLHNNRVITVGELNICFGECDCCSNIKFKEIKEYINIEIEE